MTNPAESLPEYVARNRAYWDEVNAQAYAEPGARAWARNDISWGTEAEGTAAERLLRPYFGMHRFEWPDDPGVEFHLGIGDWIRLLRTNTFEVLDFIEIQAPEGATTRYSSLVDPDWARRWPAEQVWRVGKTGVVG